MDNRDRQPDRRSVVPKTHFGIRRDCSGSRSVERTRVHLLIVVVFAGTERHRLQWWRFAFGRLVVAGRPSGIIMAQPKQGLSLLKFIPKAMRPSTSDVSSVALWGTTAACGALWLVQPFDWIKAQLSSAPKEEEDK